MKFLFESLARFFDRIRCYSKNHRYFFVREFYFQEGAMFFFVNGKVGMMMLELFEKLLMGNVEMSHEIIPVFIRLNTLLNQVSQFLQGLATQVELQIGQGSFFIDLKNLLFFFIQFMDEQICFHYL